MNRKGTTFGLALALALGLTLNAASSEKITEDDPRWDCQTMGNHQCGPTPLEPLTRGENPFGIGKSLTEQLGL